MPTWSRQRTEQFLRDIPLRLDNEQECCYCQQLTAIDEGELCEAGNFYCENCWGWWDIHMFNQMRARRIAYNELASQNAWDAVRCIIEHMYKKIKESRWLLWVLFCIMAATANRQEPMKPQEPLGFDLHFEPIPGYICIYIYIYTYIYI